MKQYFYKMNNEVFQNQLSSLQYIPQVQQMTFNPHI